MTLRAGLLLIFDVLEILLLLAAAAASWWGRDTVAILCLLWALYLAIINARAARCLHCPPADESIHAALCQLRRATALLERLTAGQRHDW